jgi:hypothetical protein
MFGIVVGVVTIILIVLRGMHDDKRFDALSQSQIYLVQQSDLRSAEQTAFQLAEGIELTAFQQAVTGRLDQFSTNLIDFTQRGDARIKENERNMEAARKASEDMLEATLSSKDAMLQEMHSLFDKMNQTTDAAMASTRAAEASTRASRASHAKLNQKIITGQEAEQLKAEAKKKRTVISFWPWPQPQPTPILRRRHR